MSPSSGVSDFTLLERNAQEVVTRCKTSTDQFRDISCEVSSVLFVLRQIGKLQEQCTLAAEDDNTLSELCRSCMQSISELEKLLDMYTALPPSRKRQLDVVRWTAKDVGTIRNKLHSSITLLSSFNSAMCNIHSSKPEIQLLSSQAEILQSMNLIQQEYQDGKRAEPAYSQLRTGGFPQDDNRIWEDVFSELGAAGFRNESTASVSFPFIRDWIRKVMPAYTADGRSETNLSRVSSWQEFDPEDDGGITTDAGEHSDTERQAHIPNAEGQSNSPKLDAHNQLMELLEVVISPKQHRSGHVKAVATQAFHSLDNYKKGYLVRFHVDEAFSRANVARITPIPDSVLSTAMKSAFREQPRRLNLEEFQRLSEKMRVAAVELARVDLLKQHETTRSLAREKLKNDLMHMLESDASKRMALPFFWEPSMTEAGTLEFTYLLDGLPLERNFNFEYFGEMSFCIARILCPRLERIHSEWTPQINTLDERSRLGYEKIFEQIADATLIFYDLVCYDQVFEEGLSFWSDLDIPLLAAQFLPNNLSIIECPFSPILEAQIYCQRLFPMVEGILYDMSSLNDNSSTQDTPEDCDKEVLHEGMSLHKLPNLERRRALRLEDRAHEISDLVSRWPPILQKLEMTRKWLKPQFGALVNEIGKRRAETMVFRKAQAKGHPLYQASLRTGVEMGESPEVYIPSPWRKAEDIFGRTFYQDRSLLHDKATIIVSSPPRLCVPTYQQRVFNKVSDYLGYVSLSIGGVAIVAFILLPILQFLIPDWVLSWTWRKDISK